MRENECVEPRLFQKPMLLLQYKSATQPQQKWSAAVGYQTPLPPQINNFIFFGKRCVPARR
jgi:hypothetical protein